MKAWTFVMKEYFFDKFKEHEEISWNSPKDIKKGDIIFVYSASPRKYIDFILEAISDPYKDPENDGDLHVTVQKRIEIPIPVELQELKDNPILSKWAPINKKKFIFQGAHHKMSKEQYNELKRLIIEKNPEIKSPIEDLEQDELTLKAKKFKIKVEEDLKKDKETYSEFLKLYPFKEHPEKIDFITPDDIYDPGNKPYFLYFIEFGLTKFGRIRVGKASYAENARNNIDKFKKLLKITVDDRISISDKVDAPWEEITFFGGDKLIAKKIIFLYNPSNTFGIYKTEHLEHFAEVILKDFKFKSNKFRKIYDDLTIGEKFEYLNDIISKFKTDVVKTDMDNVSFMRFLYDHWPIEEPPAGDNGSYNINIWKITPGTYDQREIMWSMYKENGYIGVGSFGCDLFKQKNYKAFKSYDEIHEILKEYFGKPNVGIKSRMIWNFGNVIKNGDIVVANKGNNGIFGIGVIESDYISPTEATKYGFDKEHGYYHFRKVKWMIKDGLKINEDNFFDLKTITPISYSKWKKIESWYINKNPKYAAIFKEMIHKGDPRSDLNYLLKYVLDNYHKNNDSASKKAGKVNEILSTQLPDLLIQETSNLYKLFSSAQLETQQYLYVAIMNEEITNEPTEGFFVNYMFREDMSGVYLALRHGITDIDNGKEYLIALKSKAETYRNLINLPEITSIFSDLIDLKAKESTFAPYYQASTIYSKFYPSHNLPSEETLQSDLNKILEIYDALSDIIIQSTLDDLFLKPKTVETDLKLDFNIFEQICGTLNSGKHIMLTGAPGTGKTDLAESICRSVNENGFSDGYILTTATSDWTTYDTIGGYMPSNDGKSLKFEEGKFLQAIKENKWLIIDEINRADIDKAFGQLFTVLSGQGVELPFKSGDKPIKIERIDKNRSYYDPVTATYNVGNNWRIIATMNVFDKDYLFEMSYAFMRRFTFIYINLPSLDDFRYLIYDVWGENVGDTYLSSIEGLLEINPHRPIGPAIFKDMVEYAHERDKIIDPKEDSYHKQIIKDTIISFILPQFEGLELQKIHNIWNNVLRSYDVQDDLKTRLEEISGTSLVSKSREEDEE